MSSVTLIRRPGILRIMTATSLILAVAVAQVEAGIIVYDGFDYGASDGTIAGQNGGLGFSTAWSVTQSDYASGGSYQGAGLSFGSIFAVTGGNAVIYGGGSTVPGQRNTDSRQLGVTQTGTVYGSYLFNTRLDGSSGSVNKEGISTLLIGPVAAEGANVYELSSNEFGTNNGGVRGPGTPAFPNGQLTGTAPSLNTTYLYLFKLTNVGSASETVSAWILTQAQYDHFKTAGSTPGVLLESDLNSAAPGTGSSNVLESGSFSGSGIGTLSTSDYLSMFAFNTQNSADRSVTAMDEIRIGNASLDEVAPAAVPEPSSLLLSGLAASAVFLRWRRKTTLEPT